MKTYKYEEVFEDIPGDPDNVLVNFPPDVLREAGWEVGDTLEITASDGSLKFKKADSQKDFSGNLIRINILQEEVEYAKSQLQEHDTGHIYTAISWLENRIKHLKGGSIE
jgi:hypothetical protein